MAGRLDRHLDIILLGFIVMLWAFVRFVTLENGKLDRQAAALRASGALDRPRERPAETTS